MATCRFSRVSVARYTTPIPPRPSSRVIWYGPIWLIMIHDSLCNRAHNLSQLDQHQPLHVVYLFAQAQLAARCRRDLHAQPTCAQESTFLKLT
jgi:hypothetical protein